MRNEMPSPNLDALSDLSGEARRYAEAIIGKDGRIRRSKPTRDGRVQYVWRMVVFAVSPIPQHQCMPVTADWDLARDLKAEGHTEWSEVLQRPVACHAIVRAETQRLDTITDSIISAIPKTEWHGVVRWGCALGKLGTPVMREGGTIVYR
jgi:hypothetical protein